MAKQTIRTVSELVDALGGTGETAKLLRLLPSNVSNWLAQNYIPRGHGLPLYLELQRRGYRVDVEAVFDVSMALVPPHDRGNNDQAVA